MRPFRFLADPGDAADGPSLAAAARRAEAIGYAAIVYPDHLGQPFGFLPLLTWAAAATERLCVMPFVANNDLRHPTVIAQDLAWERIADDFERALRDTMQNEVARVAA